MIVLPVLGMLWAARARDVLPKALVAGGIFVGAVSSATWAQNPSIGHGARVRKFCNKPANYGSNHDFFDLDCNKKTGGSRFERARATYAERSVAYLWYGCHPTFTVGEPTHWEGTSMGLARWGREALLELHERLGPEEPLTVVCSRRKTGDIVCQEARAEKHCRTMGDSALRCTLSAKGRGVLAERFLAADAARAQAEEAGIDADPELDAVPSEPAPTEADAAGTPTDATAPAPSVESASPSESAPH
jgi:hypothetical protein